MNFVRKINQFMHNRVFLYLSSRYFTYFIQFISSVLIAVKLGPYYFGIWSFLVLLINIFRVVDFGVPNSINVLLVQCKKDEKRVSGIIYISWVFNVVICAFVCLLAAYYFFFGIPVLDKYKIEWLFFIVCLIAILSYFNWTMMTVYRVKNALLEVAFFQSIIPLLVFCCIFLSDNRELIVVMLSAYLFGHICSLILFIGRGKLPSGGRYNHSDALVMFKKSMFLFVYNLSFYLIIISTRTMVSVFYSVEDFGYFSFSYTLANSILLVLEALAFVVFPKILDKLNTGCSNEVERTIQSIRVNYVAFSHGLIYIALSVLPFLLKYVAAYRDTVLLVSLMALTIVLNTNAFGYNAYLMARNKERTIALISFVSLGVNVLIGLMLISVWQVDYEYVLVSTMVAYSLYSYLCVYCGKKHLGQKTVFLDVVSSFFPKNLMIPYLTAIVITCVDYHLLFLPLIVFVLFNLEVLKSIIKTLKILLNRPSVINIEP